MYLHVRQECIYLFDGVSSRCREIFPLGSTKSSTFEEQRGLWLFDNLYVPIHLEMLFWQ